MPQQVPLDELTLALARINGLLLTEEKGDRAVQLLAEGIRDAFEGSSGAGVSLMDEQGNRTSTGATDPVVLEADEAQYELGRGPASRPGGPKAPWLCTTSSLMTVGRCGPKR